MTKTLLTYSLLIIGIALMTSCGSKKSEGAKGAFMAEGVVRISSSTGECALWISSKNANEANGFYPVNLDKEFCKDNLKIAFNFNSSRAPLPENCEKLQAVVISEVKVIK